MRAVPIIPCYTLALLSAFVDSKITLFAGQRSLQSAPFEAH